MAADISGTTRGSLAPDMALDALPRKVFTNW